MRAGRDITEALLGLCFAQLDKSTHATHARSVKRVIIMLANTKTILLECVFAVASGHASVVIDVRASLALHFFLDIEWKPLYKGDTSACGSTSARY